MFDKIIWTIFLVTLCSAVAKSNDHENAHKSKSKQSFDEFEGMKLQDGDNEIRKDESHLPNDNPDFLEPDEPLEELEFQDAMNDKLYKRGKITKKLDVSSFLKALKQNKKFTDKNETECVMQINKTILEFEELHLKLQALTDNTAKDDLILQMIKLITDLEFLCDSKAKANKFLESGGFDKVVYPTFEMDNKHLRSETMILLHVILKHSNFSQYVEYSELVGRLIDLVQEETSYTVKRRALVNFALVLKENPETQSMCIKYQCLETFYDIMTKDDGKLRLMLFNLLIQIMNEHNNALSIKDNDTTAQLEIRDVYRRMDLMKLLTDRPACSLFSTLLVDTYNMNNHKIDYMDTVMNVLLMVHDGCKVFVQHDYDLYLRLGEMHDHYVRDMESHGDYGSITDETDDIVRLISKIDKFRQSVFDSRKFKEDL